MIELKKYQFSDNVTCFLGYTYTDNNALSRMCGNINDLV